MSRFLAVCVLALLLSGCVGTQFGSSYSGPVAQPGECEMFADVLDQFSATGKLELLEQFQERCPGTAGADCAELLQRAVARQAGLQGRLDQLQRENGLLKKKIAQLKKLLIDLERQPR